jgi:hypothetical protein
LNQFLAVTGEGASPDAAGNGIATRKHAKIVTMISLAMPLESPQPQQMSMPERG